MSTDLSKNTLAKGLTIFEIVANMGNPNGISLNAIVEASDINRSNVYRYLMALCEMGWVERDEDTFRYRVGSKLLQMTSISLRQFDLRIRANKILQHLANEVGKTVHLAALHPPLIVYVDKIESDQAQEMISRPGLTSYCHCTAVGKAMLSTMTEEEIRTMMPETLEKRTSKTITDIDELIEHIKVVRQNGYSVDLEENEMGVGCIGAPVFGFEQKMIGAISISGPIQDIESGSIEQLSSKVIEAASKVSEKMGFYVKPSVD